MGFEILLTLSGIFFLATLIDAIRARDASRLVIPLALLALVVILALFFLHRTSGRVSFGVDASGFWALGVILAGAILGIPARYLFDLKHRRHFSWFSLLKPLCISPIVVLPLVASMQREGDIAIHQIFVLGLLAFQNGFFWHAIFEKIEASVRAS